MQQALSPPPRANRRESRRSSRVKNTVREPRRLFDQHVGLFAGCLVRRLRERRLLPRRRRTTASHDLIEGRLEAILSERAEVIVEVVSDRAPLPRDTRASGSRRITWREAIRVVAEAGGIDAFELDREVRGPAVVFGIEAVRLAARRRSDLDDLQADAAQPIDDRLAGRARRSTRQHVDAR